jgi:Ca2+/Na+ antiporter
MDKEKKLKVINGITTVSDTIVYAICCILLIAIFCCTCAFIAFVITDNEVTRYYICGLLAVLSIAASINYIAEYNKKYFKNDSDSSKRQNDFFSEEDIRRGEQRYDNRRKLE